MPRCTLSLLMPRRRGTTLSPAWASSRNFLNISIPVHTVLWVGLIPTMLRLSPTFSLPFMNYAQEKSTPFDLFKDIDYYPDPAVAR